MNKSTLFKKLVEDEEEQYDFNGYDINDIVVQDLKSQSNEYYSPSDKEYKVPPTQEDYDFLYNNLGAWRNELIRIKRNVEMHLTNSKHKLSKIHVDLCRASSDSTNLSIKEKMLAESSKRIHSVKFLQSVELRLLDVREFIADELRKEN